MKRSILLFSLLSLTSLASVAGDKELSQKNNLKLTPSSDGEIEAVKVIRDPNSDFTEAYKRQITSYEAPSTSSDEMSYHDKVLLRFSKVR